MTTVEPRRARLLYFGFGLGCLGLGVVGALLPLVPATPFLLLALWGFSRSSQRFHDWLYHHRIFGPRLQNWHTHRVVPWPVKATAYFSMLASLTYMSFGSRLHVAIVASAAAVMLVGVYFISQCPTRPPEVSGEPPPG